MQIAACVRKVLIKIWRTAPASNLPSIEGRKQFELFSIPCETRKMLSRDDHHATSSKSDRSTVVSYTQRTFAVRQRRRDTDVSPTHRDSLIDRPVAASSLGLRPSAQKRDTSRKSKIKARGRSAGGSVQRAVNLPRKKAEQGVKGLTDLGDLAAVNYLPRTWSPAASARLLIELKDEVAWEHREVRVMGRTVMQPRLVAYMADDTSLAYTYSGLTLTPLPWSPAVQEIKAALEASSGASFNSCLLNLYRDGSDTMGWHSDNEPLYGKHPTIGSASFGASRDFVLRHNQERTRKLSFPLGHGDVLLMTGATQDHWMHCIPKRAGIDAPRVNLTFRKVVQKIESCG